MGFPSGTSPSLTILFRNRSEMTDNRCRPCHCSSKIWYWETWGDFSKRFRKKRDGVDPKRAVWCVYRNFEGIGALGSGLDILLAKGVRLVWLMMPAFIALDAVCCGWLVDCVGGGQPKDVLQNLCWWLGVGMSLVWLGGTAEDWDITRFNVCSNIFCWNSIVF